MKKTYKLKQNRWGAAFEGGGLELCSDLVTKIFPCFENRKKLTITVSTEEIKRPRAFSVVFMSNKLRMTTPFIKLEGVSHQILWETRDTLCADFHIADNRNVKLFVHIC